MKSALLILGLLLGLGPAVAGPAPPRQRPNFLIMIADDLLWRDLGCTGNPDVHTPNIDRLAGESMNLAGMYTPASTCSPTRHALYTGLYPVRSGAYPNHTTVDAGTRSLFGYLKERGYRVGLQAKSHVAPPQSFPYEHLSKKADDFAALAEFIERDRSQPWLAVYASHDPHGPWNRGPRERYDPAKLTLPPWMHDNELTRQKLAAYYAEVTRLDEQVGACLTALEKSGQKENTLVVFLSEQGSSFPYGGKWSLYENGVRAAAFARWPGRIRPGSRSTTLMQYVDLPPTLLAAAGLDPAGIDTGCPDAEGRRGFDGLSFLPVLLGEEQRRRDYVFAQHTTVGINGYRQPYPMRMVSDGRHKLILNLAPDNEYWIGGIQNDAVYKSWAADGALDPALAARVRRLSHRPAEELYDIKSDPYEQRNMASDPGLEAVKKRLAARLKAWMAQQGDRGMETELAAPGRQPRRANPARPVRSRR